MPDGRGPTPVNESYEAESANAQQGEAGRLGNGIEDPVLEPQSGQILVIVPGGGAAEI